MANLYEIKRNTKNHCENLNILPIIQKFYKEIFRDIYNNMIGKSTYKIFAHIGAKQIEWIRPVPFVELCANKNKV